MNVESIASVILLVFLAYWLFRQRSCGGAKHVRGTVSERALVHLLKIRLSQEDVFHDLYLEKWTDLYSQIDAVALTSAGIIVFEVKDYTGQIFGGEDKSNWYKRYSKGQEFSFQSPLAQNEGHIRALQNKLGKYTTGIPFYSVIVFYGTCSLVSVNDIPQRTYIVFQDAIIRTLNSILKNNQPVTYTNKAKIIEELQKAVDNGDNLEIRKKHEEYVKQIQEKYSK